VSPPKGKETSNNNTNNNNVNNSKQNMKFIDANQIMHLYRLSHINLDLALKTLKTQIDQ